VTSPALIAVDKARHAEKLGEGYIPEPLTSWGNSLISGRSVQLPPQIVLHLSNGK
jgi:hypothetical protein